MKARAVYRAPFIAFVELSYHQPIFRIIRTLETLNLGVAQVVLCSIGRQIRKDDEDRFVVRLVALNRLSA